MSELEPFDLRFFFGGMQNKETSASAWLATMLRHRMTFRSGFFELIPVDPPLDPTRPWKVDVETELSGPCDVTLEDEDAFIFIENKVAESARTEGQLVRYFLGAAQASRSGKRLVAVYLGPTVATGEKERQRVLDEPLFLSRAARGSRDAVVCLGWKDNIRDLVAATTSADGWFDRTGVEAILAHISKVEAGRPPNPQRDALGRLLRRVADRLGEAAASNLGQPIRFLRWGGVGEETLYTSGRPITVMLTITFTEDNFEPYALHNVVVGDRIHLRRATVSINPSTKVGRRNPDLIARWKDLTADGNVDVPGVGRMSLANDVSLQAGRAFDGTTDELGTLLTAWGSAALRFALYVESALREGSPSLSRR